MLQLVKLYLLRSPVFWLEFGPLTRVPFGVPICDPQPYGLDSPPGLLCPSGSRGGTGYAAAAGWAALPCQRLAAAPGQPKAPWISASPGVFFGVPRFWGVAFEIKAKTKQ